MATTPSLSHTKAGVRSPSAHPPRTRAFTASEVS
jgi:hypothetical protein